MEKQIEQLQRIFSLSKYEAKIYLAGLNFESANLTELAAKAGIPRTAVFEPIKRLLSQGFLSAVKIKKRTYYRAIEPVKLKYILKRKQVELDDLTASLEKQIEIPERKLAITYFEGVAGIEMASDILLEEARSKRAKSFEWIPETIKQHGKRQLQEYINRRVQKGIHGEMIVSADVSAQSLKDLLARDKEELRKSILVDHKKYPFRSSLAVLDDAVMIFTYGENPFAVLIRNKEIARTLWSIHEMFWDRYGK